MDAFVAKPDSPRVIPTIFYFAQNLLPFSSLQSSKTCESENSFLPYARNFFKNSSFQIKWNVCFLVWIKRKAARISNSCWLFPVPNGEKKISIVPQFFFHQSFFNTCKSIIIDCQSRITLDYCFLLTRNSVLKKWWSQKIDNYSYSLLFILTAGWNLIQFLSC